MIGCVLKKVLLDEINFHRCIEQSIFVFAIKFMTYVYKSGLESQFSIYRIQFPT